MDRHTLLREVAQRLGKRNLVWSGIRGDDVEPIADLPQLEGSFSIINAYAKRTSVESMAYEDLSGVRVDLEIWDIDENLDCDATARFRRSMLQSLAQPSALLPYRPCRFLSSVYFARRDRCINLGLFGGHQAAFDHKPWVETAVADLGVAHIPWTYVADEEQFGTREMVERGPVMLRRSRTSGGEGIRRVEDSAELVAHWPRADEAFVSVAPFLEGGIPVNVGATAWHDGVTVHHPSVQLVGVSNCVTRPFGYCGNDFGLAAQLDPVLLDQIEADTTAIGRWLRRYGYLGTFGVDFLVHDGVAKFTEVNPRFQGSTHASSQLDIEAGQSCLILEHIAAFLEVDAPPQRSLREIVSDVSPFAHIVVHWTGQRAQSLDPGSLVRRVTANARGSRVDVLTRPDLSTNPGAVVARLTVRDRVTSTGFDLLPPWTGMVDDWRTQAKAPSRLAPIGATEV
ncbi:MAG: ATP-grasp domain-containing protein [Pseudonocardiaceae bacterium]